MKKLLLSLAFALAIFGYAFPQETIKTAYHEFGISFATLNDFGLRYKYGNEKTMLRVSLLALELGSAKSTTETSSTLETAMKNFGGGFNLGFDHRIPLYANFNLLLGAEIGLAYTYDHLVRKEAIVELDEKKNTYSGGLSMIFGVDYTLLGHLVLGAEINPTVMYNYSVSTFADRELKQFSQGWGFNLLNTGAGLYIAYRFGASHR